MFLLYKSNLIVGYTTQDHLLLDLDHTSLFKAVKIAKMIQKEYPDVGDCLVVESSKDHYHLVFDDVLEWEQIVRIISTLAALNIVEKNYRDVRNFRRDLTLRVSEKHTALNTRPVPEPVLLICCNHSCDRAGKIEQYLNVLSCFNDHIDFYAQKEEKLLFIR